MPQVMILDIVMKRRAVEVPEACPHCGRDLTLMHSVYEWQLTDERWRARLAVPHVAPAAGDEGDEGNGTIIDYLSGSDSGSGDNVHYGPIALYCSGCRCELATGTVTDSEVVGAKITDDRAAR